MSAIASFSGLMREMRVASHDNPLLEKDAGLVLRRVVYVVALAGFGLAMVGLFAVMVLSGESGASELARYAEPRMFGQGTLIGLVVLTAVLSSLVLPIYASASIAGERERGTFSLLVTSALTPGQIVLGKYAALVVSVAPVFLLLFPVAALSVFGGNVSAPAAVGLLAVLALGALLQIAVGLWCSAAVARVRFAGPLALGVSGVLVWPLFTFPLFGLVAAWADSSVHSLVLLPAVVMGVVTVVSVIVGCLVSARSMLAPAALKRTPARNALVTAIYVGAPILAAVSMAFANFVDKSDHRDFMNVYGHLLPLLYGLVLFVTVVLDAAAADRVRRALSDAPSPRRTLVMTALRIGVGTFGASVIIALSTPPHWIDLALSAFILTVGFTALAALVTLLGAVFVHPAVRTITGAAIALGVLIVPFLVGAVTDAFMMTPRFPLLWLNPLHQIDSATALRFWEADRLEAVTFFGLPAVVPGVVVFGLLIAFAAYVGRQERRAPYKRSPAA